ncbi:hypothetical protein Z968_00705 [Clostridium novyi A str. 4552]|uniref:Uncharacterized protein n=1 Tax=Clostridium novyi A str. 4552 TaxID=1444289 RepID=A0A0A0IBK7_CLONO|nr:hypothetical protein Z968_00705 [Clostridium novyi A str. 4552]
MLYKTIYNSFIIAFKLNKFNIYDLVYTNYRKTTSIFEKIIENSRKYSENKAKTVNLLNGII